MIRISIVRLRLRLRLRAELRGWVYDAVADIVVPSLEIKRGEIHSSLYTNHYKKYVPV
jgi:hypothetical protein